MSYIAKKISIIPTSNSPKLNPISDMLQSPCNIVNNDITLRKISTTKSIIFNR